MTDNLHIDGKDAFTEYGIFVTGGGYADLVKWPALKPVESTDWPEEDGIDVDLSAPRLDGKECKISFGTADCRKAERLFDTLADGAHHTFDFAEIGLQKKLRLVSQPDIRTLAPLQLFSLQFADDDYLNGYTHADTTALPGVTAQNVMIDGRDLSIYGVQLLAGTLNSLLKAPAVKKNLTISTKATNGTIYEDSAVKFQPKDVTLKCLMLAPDTTTFWRNYIALLHDLVQPEERLLQIKDRREQYRCYYKSSGVSKFAKLGSEVWCEFDVTLCCISARPTLILAGISMDAIPVGTNIRGWSFEIDTSLPMGLVDKEDGEYRLLLGEENDNVLAACRVENGIIDIVGAIGRFIYADPSIDTGGGGGWYATTITIPDDKDYIVTSNDLPSGTDTAWGFKYVTKI